jgi:hypothetical protein
MYTDNVSETKVQSDNHFSGLGLSILILVRHRTLGPDCHAAAPLPTVCIYPLSFDFVTCCGVSGVDILTQSGSLLGLGLCSRTLV